jgi:hypothetical protein
VKTNENRVTIDLGIIRPTCFVIMPFSSVYQSSYERVMRPAVEDAGLECVRADEVFTKPQITQEIWKQLRECCIVIAELTGKNPNVLYELGLAHALGKSAIIITRNQEDVPFDLKGLRYLFYDINDPFWGETLRRQLADMCRKVINQQDFQTVFEGINFTGEKTVEIRSIAPKRPKQLYDLSGVWNGNMRFNNRDINHSWNLHLMQKDELLTASLVVSYDLEGALTVVQQSVSGELTGKKVNLYGTSYSYLHRGNSIFYSPDKFSGQVTQEGKIIDGQVTDNFGTGNLVLTRANNMAESS